MARDVTDAKRRVVAERARYRCEYCWIQENSASFAHQIDHVISRKHGGSFATGTRVHDHFRLDGAIIEPLTPVGEVTARILRLNSAERIIEWHLLQSLDLYTGKPNVQ